MTTSPFYIRRMWSFSKALDLALVDEEIEKGFQVAIGQRHGERVAYISFRLGKILGLPQKELTRLLVAGLLHDVGAVGGFRQYHGDPRLIFQHCVLGADVVKRFPDGEILSTVLKYHHETPDSRYSPLRAAPAQVPLMAKIISLADKVDVHMARRLLTRPEREKLVGWVKEHAGSLVYPELVGPFVELAQIEAFWLDLDQPDLRKISLSLLFGVRNIPASQSLADDYTDRLAQTFADLIDQKSMFTARHSRFVAEVAERLARSLNWDEHKLHEIKTAGLLHDLGKLAIPKKILDKPGALDPEEIDVIRTHTYYTHQLLTDAGFPEHVVHWAAYHHERLDGRGYPFAVSAEKLDTGSRLMTIADMFAALTEDRPYRAALSPAQALDIIASGAGAGVDQELVALARKVLV